MIAFKPYLIVLWVVAVFSLDSLCAQGFENLDGIYRSQNRFGADTECRLVFQKGQVLHYADMGLRGNGKFGVVLEANDSLVEVHYYRSIDQDFNIGTTRHGLVSKIITYRINNTGGSISRLTEVEAGGFTEAVLNQRGGFAQGLRGPFVNDGFFRTDERPDINHARGSCGHCGRRNRHYANPVNAWLVHHGIELQGVFLNPRAFGKIKRRLQKMKHFGCGTSMIVYQEKSTKQIHFEILNNDSLFDDGVLREVLAEMLDWSRFFSRTENLVVFFDVEEYEGKLVIHSPQQEGQNRD